MEASKCKEFSGQRSISKFDDRKGHVLKCIRQHFAIAQGSLDPARAGGAGLTPNSDLWVALRDNRDMGRGSPGNRAIAIIIQVDGFGFIVTNNIQVILEGNWLYTWNTI